MAFGGEEPRPGALAFEERVGRDGGAVHDALGRREQPGAFEPEPPGQQRQPLQHAERGVLRRRGHLRQHRRPARVDRDEIGKRPPDIDADAVHRLSPSPAPRERVAAGYSPRTGEGISRAPHPHPPAASRRAPPSPSVRERGLSAPAVVTNPLSTSRSTAAESRFPGVPQPPPPPDSSTSRSPGRITRPVSLVLIGRGSLLPE